jgi:hypothetical protein
VFRNIANQNQEFVNVGLCGKSLHQTTLNAPNAINRKCRIIYARTVGIIIPKLLFLRKLKVLAKNKEFCIEFFVFYIQERRACPIWHAF